MLTPDLESGYTYPPELADEIKEKVGEYIIDIWWQHYNPGQEELLLDALHKCARQRWELSVHLMKSHPTDVFMTVFTSTDRIHHSLWHFIEPEEELDEQGKKIQEKIYEIYEEIDRGIGKIIETAGEDANILMMSDHGFGPLNGKFAINTWLRNSGLLSCAATQQKSFLRREKLSESVKWVIQKIDPSGALRKVVRKFLAHGPARMKPYRFLDYVDWEQTKAYSASNTESGIYLNLAGRETKGIVKPGEEAEALLKEIVEKLQTIRDPDTGEQMINRFAFREEIYHGPFVDQAPDIIFFVENGRYLIDVQLHPEIYLPITWKTGSGTHRIDGFFAGCGPHIRKGITLDKPGIIDLAPTILGLMGVPIPSDMEGKFLDHLIEPEFLEANPISTVTVDPTDSLGPAKRFDETETDKLSKQMKDLGYF